MATIVSEKNLITKSDCGYQVKKMTDELKDVKDAVNDLRVDVASLPEKILEKSETKFASKTTEKIVYALVGLICIAVIGSVINSTIATNKGKVDEETITSIVEKAIGDKVDKHINDNYELSE